MIESPVNIPMPGGVSRDGDAGGCRFEGIEDDCLGNHPMWPEFLAALAAIRQADRERDEREYVE